MSALYSHTTRGVGTILTAAIYNEDHQNHIDNGIPAMLGDYSVNLAQMRSQVDPAPSGTPSLATSLAAELERLRYAVAEIKGTTYWYEDNEGIQFIEEKTGAAVANLDFENGFTSDFRSLIFHFSNGIPVTDDTILQVQLKVGGAYVTSGSYKYHVGLPGSDSVNYVGGVDNAASAIPVSPTTGNTAPESCQGTVRIFDHLSATVYKAVLMDAFGFSSTAVLRRYMGAGAYVGGAGALEGVRFKFASGNIANLRVRQYGVRA